MAERFRVAVIGLGLVWQEHHEFALRKLIEGDRSIDVVAVADANPSRLAYYRKEMGLKFIAKDAPWHWADPMQFYANGVELVKSEGLDAVFLFLPPAAHGPIELACCERGVPFFVEKPLGLGLNEPIAIDKWVRQSGVKAQVGFIERYMPANEWLRFYLLSGAKPLRHALVENVNPINTRGRWTATIRTGGCPFAENTLHQVDLFRWWGYEPDTVSGMAYERGEKERLEGLDVPFAYAVQYRTKPGALVSIYDSRILDKSDAFRRHITLVCDGTLLDLDKDNVWVAAKVRKNGQVVAEFPGHEHWEPYYWEQKGFVDWVRGVQTDPNSPEPGNARSTYTDALRSWRAAVAALESAERGGELVKVDDFEAELWHRRVYGEG